MEDNIRGWTTADESGSRAAGGQWPEYLLSEFIMELTGKRCKSRASQYLLFKEARLT